MTDPPDSIHAVARSNRGLTDAARSVLERRLYAVLATQNDDGTPHVAPVWFHFDGERIIIETGAATRKARNVAARPHASVLVHTPEATWVLGTGPAHIVSGGDAARHRHGIRTKYFTARGQEVIGDFMDELDDVVVLIEPTHWLSWDLTGFMHAVAARGIDPTDADTWFVRGD